MLVIDASTWFDLFNTWDEERRKLAERFFEKAEHHPIYEPPLFKIELAGLLVRRVKRRVIENLIREILAKVVLYTGLHDEAYNVALETGCRAADAYCIACAKLTGSTLVSNDRIQVLNARKAGVKAYYLLGEAEDILRQL